MPHIAQRVKGEDPYIKGLNLTIWRPFFESVSLIEKQNQGRLVGNCVCTIAALNRKISSEDLGRYI